MGSAFHQLCPRYSGTLTPTAPTAIKLWDTFTFTITAYICGVPRGSKAPIRVDPYFKNTGRPVNIRVDPYFTSLLAFTGTVKYESTYNLRVDPCYIWVDLYFH